MSGFDRQTHGILSFILTHIRTKFTIPCAHLYLEERNHSQDLGIDGNIITIIMDLRIMGWQDVDWIRVAQDTDKWWALAKTLTFGFNNRRGIS
jgi:hypothetical protein